MPLSPDFLITALMVVVSPGSGALYTISTGLARGAKTSVIAAFGCTLGTLPHMLATVTGLAALLHTSPLAFAIIKYAGALWLLYLAWSTLRHASALHFNPQQSPQTAFIIIRNAILLNLLNPKLPLFFLAFLPQFIDRSSPSPLAEMLTLSGVFMLMTLAVFMLYGTFSAAMRYRILSRPAVMAGLRYGFAAGFAGLAIKLFFSQL